jgi:hypothetical protein
MHRGGGAVGKEREVSRERHRELTRRRWGALGATVTVMAWSGNISSGSQRLGCWRCPEEEEREKRERERLAGSRRKK